MELNYENTPETWRLLLSRNIGLEIARVTVHMFYRLVQVFDHYDAVCKFCSRSPVHGVIFARMFILKYTETVFVFLNRPYHGASASSRAKLAPTSLASAASPSATSMTSTPRLTGVWWQVSAHRGRHVLVHQCCIMCWQRSANRGRHHGLFINIVAGECDTRRALRLVCWGRHGVWWREWVYWRECRNGWMQCEDATVSSFMTGVR